MGACLGTETGQRYQVDTRGVTPPPPSSNNGGEMGQKMSVEQNGLKPPLDVAIVPVTPSTPVEHKTKPKPPSSLAITPATPQTTKTVIDAPLTASTANSTCPDDVEPRLFHFAFNSTLKGESATDTLVVTPDLLKKPTDFPKAEGGKEGDRGKRGGAERHESNVSRISSVSVQTCDTISNRSDLSRNNSAASTNDPMAHHNELTLRTTTSAPLDNSHHRASSTHGSAAPSVFGSNGAQSTRTSSARSSSELRTLSAASAGLRDSMTGEVVMRKKYMKSLLTVRQSSTEPTPVKDVLQWKRGNCLGRGSFGTVYLGLTDTGELIAVKQMEVSTVGKRELEAEYSKIYREVEILKHLKHKNIVQYLGSSFENNTISIFTQFVSGGSLQNLIQQFGPLGEGIASKYTKQLLSAIAYLHENKVVHRDIKSGNIMMTPEGVLKLIDFGCARKLAIRVSMTGGSHMMRSWKGTPYWMAPEVIHESGHGKKSDIWSLGCTVFEMLTGIPPWGDREPIAAIYAIGCEDVPMPQLDESFTQDAREFVDKCLIKDKFKRPCASALQLHSFIYPVTERQISDTCSEDSKWVETL